MLGWKRGVQRLAAAQCSGRRALLLPLPLLLLLPSAAAVAWRLSCLLSASGSQCMKKS